MARPLLEIDAKEVEKLAGYGCKTEEIADFFNCDPKTITNRFSAELAKGRAGLKKNLRIWQIEVARKGNATMLIWLGKQMLGQRDKSDEEIAGEIAQAQILTIEQYKELVKTARGQS